MKFLEVTVYRIILRTYLYLEATGRKNSFERFPYLCTLTERLTEDALEEWRRDDGVQAMRYQRLLLRMNDAYKEPPDEGSELPDSVVCTALDLCLAALYVPEFSAYLNYYTGNGVTIQLAFEIEGLPFPDYIDSTDKLKKLQKVCWADPKKNPRHFAEIEGDDFLLAYLTGETDMDKVFFADTEWFFDSTQIHPMFIREELCREGAEWLGSFKESSSAGALQISGRGGRRFLAKHIARCLGRSLLLVDAAKWETFHEDERARIWSRFVHAAFLQEALVCIYGIAPSLLSHSGKDETDFVKALAHPFLDSGIPVILCSKTGMRFSASKEFPVWNIELKELSREEREAVFSGIFDLYHIPLDSAYYSVRYRLTASEIARAANEYHLAGGRTFGDFSKICESILYHGQKKIFGSMLYPSFEFDDLKVPPHIREVLGQICSAAREGYRIFEEWNLSRLYPYGRAVTVLLLGPPGTGKTMTAHVIAKELGLPLYQVDLSHVMDKYIGETEKHLEEIFTFAERVRPVLFFDEADALFGKRSQTAEGKDRYANMEVSYILQRIERFDGIVLLATNFYSNIDKAFLRRIKYVLKYQTPDARLRRSIWESCLTPELPREDLDVEYLARQFDFTGDTIKNVMYTACVTAVHEGTRISMKHIMKAILSEYDKIDRAATEDMWGEYGYLMEDAVM